MDARSKKRISPQMEIKVPQPVLAPARIKVRPLQARLAPRVKLHKAAPREQQIIPVVPRVDRDRPMPDQRIRQTVRLERTESLQESKSRKAGDIVVDPQEPLGPARRNRAIHSARKKGCKHAALFCEVILIKPPRSCVYLPMSFRISAESCLPGLAIPRRIVDTARIVLGIRLPDWF